MLCPAPSAHCPQSTNCCPILLHLHHHRPPAPKPLVTLKHTPSVPISLSIFKRGFPCGSTGEESACKMGDLGSSPGLVRAPGEGKGYPLQYSGLENSMDSMVHGVAKSQTRLSDFHSLIHSHL